MLVLINLIVLPICFINCKPQVIMRDNTDASHRDFDSCKEPTILWEEDGECYEIGQRGPCEVDEIFILDKRAYETKCVKNTRMLNPFQEPVEESSEDTSEEISSEENSSEELEEPSDFVCNNKDQVFWPEDAECYPLLEQGPCPENQWLVIDYFANSTSLRAKCVGVPCADPDNQVFYPAVCQCVDIFNNISSGRYTPAEICGENSRLTWTPFGEGVCTCKEDHLHDENSDICYKIGSQGPCKSGEIWTFEDSEAKCMLKSAELANRILDLLHPERTARIVKCNQDAAGKCRKTFGLNIPRFGGGISELQQRVNSFTPSRQITHQEKCEDACSADNILWHDGQCYQAASTGPCQPNTTEWLVLDTIIDQRPILRCSPRQCGDEQVLMNCKCQSFSTSQKSRIDLTGSLCPGDGNGWNILISPYGTGICSCGGVLSNEGKTCSGQSDLDFTRLDFISKRKSEVIPDSEDQLLATRSNCKINDGICQKNEISDNHTVDSKDGTLQDLVDWLQSFPKEESCFSHENLVRTAESNDIRKCLEGQVLFKDKCESLLESSACKTDKKWLVAVENSDSISVACVQKPSFEDNVYLPEQCKKVSKTNSSDWCNLGTVDIDIFGQGVCKCNNNDHIWFARDGSCYPENESGPCQDGEVLTRNINSYGAVCQPQDKVEKKKEACSVFSDFKIGSKSVCPSGYLLMMDDGKMKCKQSVFRKIDITVNSAYRTCLQFK